MSFAARLFPLMLAASVLPFSQVVFPGCATVVDGPIGRIRVASKPPRATIYLDGKRVGETPALLTVSRWRTPRLRIELEGYQPFDLQLEKGVTWDVMGNFFLLYTPIVIDAATGSMFTLEIPKDRQKDVVTRPWDKEEQAATSYEFRRNSLYIGVVLHPLDHGRKIGQLRRL